MNPPFVKKFDFRGIYDKDITDKDAFYLGLAIKKAIPLKKILVGWDTRASSKQLALNFIHAFQGTAVEISYIDQSPIDYITAAANVFDFDFSVMFTGSHNPWDWTGLLMHTSGGASVEGDLVNKIVAEYKQILGVSYISPSVNLADYTDFQPTIEKVYREKIQELIPLQSIRPMNVVVDLGDGSGYKALEVLSSLLPQVTFTNRNDRRKYDSDTPHTADPSNIENMTQVMQEVKNGQFDCGFAFDSDADRVLAVDEKGEYVNGSLIGSAMIDTFSELKAQMRQFGYAVECGPAMYNTALKIRQKGENALTSIPVPVGRSIMRRLIREGKVDLAVENVGHFYSKTFFMTDSGAFSLVVVLYWISMHGALSTLATEHPDGLRTQFSVPTVPEEETSLEKLTTEINEHFAGREQKKIEVDGIRYEYFEEEKLVTWYSMRPSGYEPIEKFYFGSLNENDYNYLQEKIRKE